MYPSSFDANITLDGDSIELFACPRCPSLGVLQNHASGYFRCPTCHSLCSLGDEVAPARRMIAGKPHGQLALPAATRRLDRPAKAAVMPPRSRAAAVETEPAFCGTLS